jgi:hypothetical protein
VFCGGDRRALQAVVDCVTQRSGGTVRIGSGRIGAPSSCIATSSACRWTAAKRGSRLEGDSEIVARRANSVAYQ